jgi:polyadenylate-binding protein
MSARLIVDRLPSHWRDDDVARLFGSLGTIRSIHIVRDGHGRSLNFGYVEMDQLEDACRAVSALHGKELHGTTLTVSLAQESPLGARSKA